MAGVDEYWNGIPFTSHAQPTTWATRLSLELAKGVIGVARAFGTSILLLGQISIPDIADRVRRHRLTNVAADKHFFGCGFAAMVIVCCS
jgi:hypothetical protein